jgi:hypothetical protein
MWWRKIIAKLFGYRIVWIQHHDGKVYLRLVTTTPFGLLGYQYRTFGEGEFTCLPGGTCSGASYITRWKPA